MTTRGLVGETLSVTVAVAVPDPAEMRSALGAAVVVGSVLGLVLAGSGLVAHQDLLGRWMFLFGLGLPILVLQDAFRFAGFATHRPHLAALSDASWLLVQLLGWAGLAMADLLTAESLLVVWWLAALAGIVAVVPHFGLPRPGVGWLRDHAALSTSFAAERVLQSAGTQGAVYMVGLVAGLPAAGSLRAAQSLFGPLRSLTTGVGTVVLPEMMRRRTEEGWSMMRRYAVRTTFAMSALGVLAVGVLMALPDSIGRLVLGETWPGASQLILPVGLALLGEIAVLGARLGLRATQATSAALRLRSITGAQALVFGVGGAAVGGLLPAAWGLAVAHILGAGLGWALLARARMQAGSA